MSVPHIPPRPYSPGLVAQSRQIVTRFDTVIAQEGLQRAQKTRIDAWQILLADHAARLQARQLALRHPSTGDAA